MASSGPTSRLLPTRSFVRPRRWSTKAKKDRIGEMTDKGISPEEARTALMAVVLQMLHTLEDVHDYDPRGDVFYLHTRDALGKRHETEIRGELVGKVVAAARALRATEKLKRPSEVLRALRKL